MIFVYFGLYGQIHTLFSSSRSALPKNHYNKHYILLLWSTLSSLPPGSALTLSRPAESRCIGFSYKKELPLKYCQLHQAFTSPDGTPNTTCYLPCE